MIQTCTKGVITSQFEFEHFYNWSIQTPKDIALNTIGNDLQQPKVGWYLKNLTVFRFILTFFVEKTQEMKEKQQVFLNITQLWDTTHHSRWHLSQNRLRGELLVSKTTQIWVVR